MISSEKTGETWLLIGAPAAGKSTFSYKLKTMSSGFKQFSVRLHIQKLINEGSELGQLIVNNKYLEKKEFIPDSIVGRIFDDFVGRITDNDFLLIEGFPINDNQFDLMVEALEKRNRKVNGMIVVEAALNVLEERIRMRKVCRRCELKNTGGVPIPQGAEVCPYCGGKLDKRDDDTPETFTKRYGLFLQEKQRLLKWMQGKKIIVLDGSEERRDEVISEMAERLSS